MEERKQVPRFTMQNNYQPKKSTVLGNGNSPSETSPSIDYTNLIAKFSALDHGDHQGGSSSLSGSGSSMRFLDRWGLNSDQAPLSCDWNLQNGIGAINRNYCSFTASPPVSSLPGGYLPYNGEFSLSNSGAPLRSQERWVLSSDEAPLSCASSLQNGIGALNKNYYPFTETPPISSLPGDYFTETPPISFLPGDYLPYKRVMLNSQNSDGLAYQGLCDGNIAEFGVILSNQENIFRIITQPDECKAFLKRVRALNESESLNEIWRFMLGLASNPFLLCHSACNKDGSISLQTLIRTLRKSPFISYLTEALAEVFLVLAFDSSGRRVIRECFKELSIRYNEVLSVLVLRHCIDLATDRAGCICLNECLPFMESTYKHAILSEIHDNAVFLAEDRYGTYVMQHAILMEHPRFTPLIAEKIRTKIPSLTTQREGSYLVEKCLRCSSSRRIVVEELLKLIKNELRRLACNECGNFVIQKALTSTMESLEFHELHWKLQKALRPLAKDLQSHPFGSKVYEKLYKERKKATGHK